MNKLIRSCPFGYYTGNYSTSHKYEFTSPWLFVEALKCITTDKDSPHSQNSFLEMIGSMYVHVHVGITLYYIWLKLMFC